MVELTKLWGHTERPWGYEIRAIFREEGKTEDINMEMTFPKEPDEKQIDVRIGLKKEQIEKQLAEIPKEPIKDSFTREEVIEFITAFKAEITAKEISVPVIFKEIVTEVTKLIVIESVKEVMK